jgi:hypothetical protein
MGIQASQLAVALLPRPAGAPGGTPSPCVCSHGMVVIQKNPVGNGTSTAAITHHMPRWFPARSPDIPTRRNATGFESTDLGPEPFEKGIRGGVRRYLR